MSATRRSFIRLTGIAGILAAGRAPAFAQGTKLHIVRWVDFIPESDVELKRQMPEASKALGAEVVEAVKFMQTFWKECCDEGGLAWDDTNNNRAFHAGEIMKHSKNQKLAKDFLRWLHKKENFEKWFLSQEAYSVGGPLKMFRTAARSSRLFGYAGPSTAKATETFTKYIVTDMYAKAVQGMKAEDAVKWAEGELKKIYES